MTIKDDPLNAMIHSEAAVKAGEKQSEEKKPAARKDGKYSKRARNATPQRVRARAEAEKRQKAYSKLSPEDKKKGQSKKVLAKLAKKGS